MKKQLDVKGLRKIRAVAIACCLSLVQAPVFVHSALAPRQFVCIRCKSVPTKIDGAGLDKAAELSYL